MTSTPWGGRIVYRPVTGSTMDDAQALEDAGVPEGSVAWAGYQTAGRGRHTGRTWRAEAGQGLLFTAYWNPERFAHPSFAPSLVVGLGVCLWLESLGLSASAPVALKWPNDVFWGDRKVAGILVRRRITSRGGSLHAGFGINLRTPAGEEFRRPVTSLADAGVELSAELALAGLLPYLAQALAFTDAHALVVQRLWKRGEVIEVSLPERATVLGRVSGLTPEGALLLETEAGLFAIVSGE